MQREICTIKTSNELEVSKLEVSTKGINKLEVSKETVFEDCIHCDIR